MQHHEQAGSGHSAGSQQEQQQPLHMQQVGRWAGWNGVVCAREAFPRAYRQVSYLICSGTA